ncbi:MAG: response regulator [SAR324 cluster bacterium]|nr:response regulator [SAR324 cluster bacterium]
MSKSGILIVEDEVLIAMDIQQKLEKFGYSVCGIAASGEAALVKVIETQPELILMDIVIQGRMDGIETAKKIQEQFGIPVIYLTAYSDEKNLRRAKITQPSGYLLKPYSERELEITIELALHKKQMSNRLENQQHWYATILKSLGEAIITFDTDQTVLYINPAAEALVNRQATAAVGNPLALCCRLQSAGGVWDLQHCLKQVLEQGVRVQKFDLQLTDDPAQTVVDLSVVPILGEQGQIKGGVAVLHDKTETRLLLQKLDEQVNDAATKDLLTYREKQVLQFLVEGQATKQLADTLGISPRTVEFHRYNLMRKLQVEDIPSLVRRALSQGLVDLE